MSEIEKMYKNANIEKEVIKGCYDYYSKLGIDIWKENDCRGKNCDTCKKDKSIKRYPPFTAEKQIELIKWLNLNDKIDCFLSRHNELRNEWVLSAHCVTEFANEEPFIYPGFNKEFSQALAMLINFLWQDLTEEDKTSIKNILEM